jgi:hypothetical protein
MRLLILIFQGSCACLMNEYALNDFDTLSWVGIVLLYTSTTS